MLQSIMDQQIGTRFSTSFCISGVDDMLENASKSGDEITMSVPMNHPEYLYESIEMLRNLLQYD